MHPRSIAYHRYLFYTHHPDIHITFIYIFEKIKKFNKIAIKQKKHENINEVGTCEKNHILRLDFFKRMAYKHNKTPAYIDSKYSTTKIKTILKVVHSTNRKDVS